MDVQLRVLSWLCSVHTPQDEDALDKLIREHSDIVTLTLMKRGAVAFTCLVCDPASKFIHNIRYQAAKDLRRHLNGPKHAKKLENAKAAEGGLDVLKRPARKMEVQKAQCFGIELYPLEEGETATYTMNDFLHTMVRFIPHNIDNEIILSETKVGTRGLLVRSRWCSAGKSTSAPCDKCKAAANSQLILNRAIKWVSKLDGLEWYEICDSGAHEDVKTAFCKNIDNRDYVSEGRGSEIGDIMSITNIAQLRTAVATR